MKTLLLRTWNSPTLMTWGNQGVRIAGVLLLLPAVLKYLSAGEIVVWYVFVSVASLQWVFDFGVGATLSRAVSYAFAGATQVRGFRESDNPPAAGRAPNWELMQRLVTSMRSVYLWLAISALVVVAGLGTWALRAPIDRLDDPDAAWLAWVVVLVFFPVGLWSNSYSGYLEGGNRVALVRRWDIMLGAGSIATGLLALVLEGGLLGLALATQPWLLVRALRDRALCRWLDDGRFARFRGGADPAILRDLWPSAWRSGVGGLMSHGLLHASNLLAAQVQDTGTAAAYLVSMRLLEGVVQFSMAPFYSQLPVLVRLRAEGNLEGLVAVARRGMTLSYWSYVIGFLALAAFGPAALVAVGSNAGFVSPGMWLLMGAAFLAHRYGAMHVQIYSTTNHIISHVADAGAGFIFAAVAMGALPWLGVAAIPTGLLCGYLGFYCWYAAGPSYASMKCSFWPFERAVLLPPLAILLAFAVVQASR